MAKRSDFAQKLLDDLRLRKERLASSSQSLNCSSSSMAIIDAYSYARQNYRGSKDISTNNMIGSRTGSAQNRTNGSGRSFFGAESSQHIVPYSNGRSQSSNQIGDLSTALAFALENGGKIGRIDSSSRGSMLSFLQQIGMKTIDPDKIGTRIGSARFPAFSRLQIEEISKGVHRLNQILRACSENGVSFDERSVRIGKELLKGAMDLEKSLKMLVNSEESSEHIVESKRKKQIKLLEEDEDEEIIANTGVNQRLESTLTEDKIQSSCTESSNKNEKARIPNVIAKLMGLEKLPEEERSANSTQKNTGSKPKDGGTFPKSTQEINKFSGHNANKATDNVAPPKKLKLSVEANPFVLNTSFMVAKGKASPANISREAAIDNDEKPKKVATKKEKNHEIVKRNMEASQLMQQKRRAQNIHMEIQKPLMVKRSVSDERNQRVKLRKQKISELTSQTSSKSTPEKLNKKNSKRGNNSTQSEVYTNGKNQDELLVRERSSAESNIQRARVMKAMDEKVVHVQKARAKKAQSKIELPRRINGTLNDMASSTRQLSSVTKGVKPTRLVKLRSEPNDKVAEKAFDLYGLRDDDVSSLQESENLARNDDLCQSPSFCEEKEIECCSGVANELDATVDIHNTKPETNHEKTTIQTTEETTKPAEPSTLTESENRLKQILSNSQLFLNTAESLFRLDIPITTHHSNTTHSYERDLSGKRKLILDCGYELMRRKVRRKEMTVHTSLVSDTRSFECLVRELNRDFEKLRMYGNEGLAGMQENDVFGKETDVNCMWDLGWNDGLFAVAEVGEVVRDVEKAVINGLLHEIAADLILRV